MSGISQDLSTPAVIQAIEAQPCDAFELFGRWPRMEVHREAGLLWTITDVSFAFLNSVVRTELAADRVDDAIEAAIARSRSRQVPVLWWTGPGTRPATLAASLKAHGFVQDVDVAGMAADLQAVPERMPTSSAHVVVEEVGDRATLETWCHTVVTGFGWSDSVAVAFRDLFSSTGYGGPGPVRLYLGRMDGEPIATSASIVGAGVAGIYFVTTLPGTRRRGAGTAVTFTALQQARAMGYRVAMLQAMDMGAPVYRRLGFREYFRIVQYVWPPAPKSR